jgi:hypothetical protein
MEKLSLDKKVDKNGFMLACDTVYFNNWTKVLYYSLKENCSWAHIHFHLFDPTSEDLEWLSKRDCSFSFEITPIKYCSSLDMKKMYWVTARYTRFAEIYEDSTIAINLDSDSIVVKKLPYEIFEAEIATAKDERGSAV